jgi:hypothetical protein
MEGDIAGPALNNSLIFMDNVLPVVLPFHASVVVTSCRSYVETLVMIIGILRFSLIIWCTSARMHHGRVPLLMTFASVELQISSTFEVAREVWNEFSRWRTVTSKQPQVRSI